MDLHKLKKQTVKTQTRLILSSTFEIFCFLLQELSELCISLELSKFIHFLAVRQNINVQKHRACIDIDENNFQR